MQKVKLQTKMTSSDQNDIIQKHEIPVWPTKWELHDSLNDRRENVNEGVEFSLQCPVFSLSQTMIVGLYYMFQRSQGIK